MKAMATKKLHEKCPICGRPVQPDHQPFCSARCADVDLNRWLGGVYAVPGERVAPPAGSGLTADGDDEA